MTNHIQSAVAYTDGSVNPNPGHGGAAALIKISPYMGKSNEKNEYALLDYSDHTTNNQMELLAAVMVMEHIATIHPDIFTVQIVTDSQYVRNGWYARKYKPDNITHASDSVNAHLWERMMAADYYLNASVQWVRGHSGHPVNDLADRLANHARVHKIRGVFSLDILL